MAFNFLHNPSTTPSEYFAAVGRITRGAVDGLTLTHLPTIAAGSLGLFTIGLAESRLWLRPTPSSNIISMAGRYAQLNFMVRYGLSQLIPSIIPETQPASIIARRAGLEPSIAIYSCADTLRKEQPSRYLRYIRSVSLRCALAGSILLSQVIALADILINAQEDYIERIKMGEEPPLDVHPQTSSGFSMKSLAATLNTNRVPGLGRQGVVVRLAGERSDVTMQSLALEGRKRIFPIFEDSDQHGVQTIVREYGCGAGGGGSGNPLIPVYWRVPDGRYGRADSWRDLKLPASWLSNAVPTVSRVQSQKPTQLLLLEADATRGDSDSLSLQRMTSMDLDLDLYEIEQGFRHLAKCVDAPPGTFDVARVLLVDPEVMVEKGGGFAQKADEYVRELGLADVVIDARRPLTYAMTRWLESLEDTASANDALGKKVNKKWAQLTGRQPPLRPVILWTPMEDWFQSIRSELEEAGYDIICYTEAIRRYGREYTQQLPMFVYEKSIADSVHSTSRLVESGHTGKDTVCALFPQHFNKNRGEEEHHYASICSTSLYNRLFYWVRDRILQGWTTEEIQKKLDRDLGGVLAEAKLPYSHDIGEEALLALLCEACLQGDTEEAENLIHQGADPNAGDYDGRKPVHLAAASAHVSVLELLYLEHNVDLHVIDKFGNTPISEAVRNNRLDAIEWLRKRGATLDVDTIKSDIYEFCYKGESKKLKRYIVAGCDINVVDYDGRTPLMIAASFGQSEVIKELLLAGADTGMKDRWGQTALDAALIAQNTKCYNMLRNTRFTHLLKDDTVERSSAAESVRQSKSLKFMQQPRKPSTKVQRMLSAANEGNLKELQRLVAIGDGYADVQDYDARTPLHLAAAGGHLEAVKYLCSLPDININAMDRWHQTPAIEAHQNGFIEISMFLREKGATTVLRNIGYRICKAAAEGDISTLEEMQQGGSDLNSADYDGRTAAYLAASNGHLKALKWLVSNGARIDLTDRFNNTPVDDAIREDHTQVIDFLRQTLLQRGIDRTE